MTTRNRALLLSGILTIVYILFHQFEFLGYWGEFRGSKFIGPTASALTAFAGLFWVLHGKVGGTRVLTICLYAALSIFIFSLFSELIIFSQSRLTQITASLTFTMIVFFINYLVILTMNIINYSYLNTIPLGQAGRASSYILSLIAQYMAIFMIYSNESSIYFKVIAVSLLSLFYSYCLLWSLKLNRKSTLRSANLIGIAVFVMVFILSIWPIAAEIIALIVCLFLYVSLGLALEIKEKISRYLWLEYAFLFLLAFIILILFSDWGINGHLI